MNAEENVRSYQLKKEIGIISIDNLIVFIKSNMINFLPPRVPHVCVCFFLSSLYMLTYFGFASKHYLDVSFWKWDKISCPITKSRHKPNHVLCGTQILTNMVSIYYFPGVTRHFERFHARTMLLKHVAKASTCTLIDDFTVNHWHHASCSFV